MAANLLTGRVQQRIGPRRTILTGAIVMTASLAGLLIINGVSGYAQTGSVIGVALFGSLAATNLARLRL